MAITSRSARQFMRRNGILETPRRTLPKLNLSGLLINTVPLRYDQLSPTMMLDANGDPPPDRGITEIWPPPQEVLVNGEATSESA